MTLYWLLIVASDQWGRSLCLHSLLLVIVHSRQVHVYSYTYALKHRIVLWVLKVCAHSVWSNFSFHSSFEHQTLIFFFPYYSHVKHLTQNKSYCACTKFFSVPYPGRHTLQLEYFVECLTSGQAKHLTPDLGRWLQCFAIYTAVVLTKFPDRATSLMLFAANIANLSQKFRCPF